MRDSCPMKPSQCHFDDGLNQRERDTIRQALATIEERNELPAIQDVANPPWLITEQNPFADGRQLKARRLGSGRSFSAGTAGELARKITTVF